MVVIFFPLTMRVVVVVLLMLALPGPASELLKVENEVKVFPFPAACAKMSSRPCMPNPNGLNSDEVSEVLGWLRRPCLWCPCPLISEICVSDVEEIKLNTGLIVM